MLKLSVCCILAAILVSCAADTKVKNDALIKGDWVSERVNAGFRNNPMIFCFTDSMCINRNPFNSFTKYSLNGNALIVQPDSINNPDAQESKYIITNLTRDSLFLQPDTDDTAIRKLIRLERIKEVNTLIPERIFFASSGCFGSCPSLFLEIDSSRNFLFYGAAYTTLDSGYRGKINSDLYNELCRKIRQLPLSGLKEFYEAGWTDDQVCGVSIKANGKLITSSAYGFNEEPAALRILLNFLMGLYQQAVLVKDSSVTHFYFESQPEFRRITKAILPPPVK
jgi:Domain of unknown function (DUF6438)